MIEIQWQDLPVGAAIHQPASLTIGVFDGVHRGHRQLIRKITGDVNLLPVVVTFEHHPAEVLAPDAFPGFIMSPNQKRMALEQAGVKAVVCVDFSIEFSRMPGHEFLDRLMQAFDLRYAAIGHDFHCGGGKAMDGPAVRSYLQAQGVAVDLVGPVRDREAVVSSTRIRDHIKRGQLEAAESLLGHPFSLDVAREVATTGRNHVAYRVNAGLLLSTRQIVPPPGVYTVNVNGDAFSAQTTLTIADNYLRLPLAADDRIRYIDFQEKRVL